jgi:serine/threonine-protein kinase
MEYVEGGDLFTALATGQLSGSAAVAALVGVADALTYAHEQHVVHRDVKPANVLLAGDGAVKLGDFGLARRSTSTAFRTAADVVSGTPMYMAPEQIKQPWADAPAVDAYAFAVLAYEVLTGHPPFTATGLPDVIEASLHAAPIAPWQWRPALPTAVGKLLLSGLDKRAAHRCSPAQLAAALRSVDPGVWDGVVVPRPRPAVEPVEATRTGTDRAVGSTSASAAAAPITMSLPPPAVDRPAPDVWIDPPVFRPARTQPLRRRVAWWLAGVGAGVGLTLVVEQLAVRR